MKDVMEFLPKHVKTGKEQNLIILDYDSQEGEPLVDPHFESKRIKDLPKLEIDEAVRREYELSPDYLVINKQIG